MQDYYPEYDNVYKKVIKGDNYYDIVNTNTGTVIKTVGEREEYEYTDSED